MWSGSQLYLGYLWLIFVFCGGFGVVVDCQILDDVNMLLIDLFINYNFRVCFVQNQMGLVVMDVSLYLFSVNEVDEVNEKLVIMGFLDLKWNDVFLQWDFNSYSGIDLLNFLQVCILVIFKLLIVLYICVYMYLLFNE